MCIYCNTNNYRKIYENHYGVIPQDLDGRTYDIHHIDGDRSNNRPENLLCVSIRDHLEIHKKQGDWAACTLLAAKMRKSPEEISNLASLQSQKQLAEGKHPFQKRADGTSLASDRVKSGTHHLLKIGGLGQSKTKERVKNGTHPFLKKMDGNSVGKAITSERVKNKSHNFFKDSVGDSIGKQTNVQRLENKTHNFLVDHPNKIQVSCLYCKKSGSYPMMVRHHLDKCKCKPINPAEITRN